MDFHFSRSFDGYDLGSTGVGKLLVMGPQRNPDFSAIPDAVCRASCVFREEIFCIKMDNGGFLCANGGYRVKQLHNCRTALILLKWLFTFP